MTISKQYIHILLFLLLCSYYSTEAAAKNNTVVLCLPDQASFLLQLKRSFIDVDGNLASWQAGRDCCHWEGITCDMTIGRVVSIDLGGFNLTSGRLDPVLFNLTSLRNLSLAFNDFNGSNLPSHGFERLTGIVHINFSGAGFYGQIPIEIGHLKNLATLDFSRNYALYLREPNFQTFMANLSNLRELYFDQVDISSSGSTWSVVLANSVPQLQVLSLYETGISGHIHPSFSRLHSLTVINLGSPNYRWPQDKSGLTGKVPEFFAEFTSLTILDISNNYLEGQFPTRIFRIKSLRILDMSGNLNLSVCLPDFPVENNLETLNLFRSTLSCDILPSFTNLTSLKKLGLITTGFFNGGSLVSKLPSLNELSLFGWKPVLSWVGNFKCLVSLELDGYDFSQLAPSWIGNLTSLAHLDVRNCNLSKLVPYQIGSLANLTTLWIESCNCTGQPVPLWIGNLTKLTELTLLYCNFSGPIPSTVGNLAQLETLDLAINNLSGKIPKSLFVLPDLQRLSLNLNQLSSLEDTPALSSSPLSDVDLSNNQIIGPIPKSFFQLKHLESLDLSSNRFSGTIELSSFWVLKNLWKLSLSNNMLTIVEEEIGNTLPSFPNIIFLELASCNLKKLPLGLRYLNKIWVLDLSNNQINGVIPSWIWKNQLTNLKLRGNMFTSLEKSPSLVHMPQLSFLDLSSNRLQGTVPIPLATTIGVVLDYSNNSFSSIVPNFGRYIRNTAYLDLSNNKLNGHVPTSICSASQLTLMDLSYNNFSGPIPSCLIKSGKLNVLKLRENQFHGTLPENITEGCKFETVDLSGNQIEGKLPISLSNCQDLELLDVGNNQIIGAFPSWLGDLPKLRVLVLKSNQLNGTIRDITYDPSTNTHFMSLQILDLASNNFSGNLPKGWFDGLKAMMTTDNEKGQVLGHDTNSRGFYQDTITITFKGFELVFTQILTTFKAIDFSNNSFSGPIPESIMSLVSLHGLNMSYNNFTGQITYQLSKLSQLESLDLSCNQLSGEIPQELTSLTSLEWLNISYNNLTGRIPHENQFSTFSNNSFEGNAGLCGIPLSKQCDNQGSIDLSRVARAESNNLWQDKLDVIVLFAFVGLGFGVGFTLSILLQMFFRIEEWVCKSGIHT